MFTYIKKKLEIRNSIHLKNSMEKVLSTGCNRASLLGVQLIILFKSSNEKYEALIWQRQSEKAIVYPEYYQFPPAGLFDVTENYEKIKRYDIKRSFPVGNVVFREFLEELFENECRGTGIDGTKVNASVIEAIEDHKRVKEIQSMINDGLAFLEFLGTAVDLVNLRNDLCFVLRIDDVNYLEKNKINFTANEESEMHFKISIEDIDKLLKKENMVPASVGLWYLLKKNRLFYDIKSK